VTARLTVVAALAYREETGMADDDVTGRDGYVTAKALAYAIAYIDSLPEKQREASDRDDMRRILVAKVSSSNLKLLCDTVEKHTGRRPDIYIGDPEGTA
jgi:hypothetical protein